MNAEIASNVAANCRSKSAELIGALERSLAGKWQLADARVIRAAEVPPRPGEGPGLLMELNAADQPVLLVLPDPGRLLPPWCAQPSRAHVEILARLAREVGQLVLSDAIAAECCRTVWRENLAGDMPQLVDRLSDCVVVQFVRESQPLTLSIYWASPYSAANPAKADSDDELSEDDAADQFAAHAPQPPRTFASRAATYSRSLLRIKVPVKVTLARKKQPIGHIIELGPGAIIHFEKSCEEMLDLEVGGQTVAQGEPVKVGDKFGIRLTSLATPQERFLSLASRSAARHRED